MRQSRDWLATHTVTVETYTTDGFRGARRQAAATKTCGLEEVSKLVTANNGSEVTATATLFCPLTDLATYTPETWVTFRPGRRGTVVAVAVHDSAGSPSFADVDHIEVSLA